MQAAVTSNTALELLRKPHEDVLLRAIKPFFNNDFRLVTVELCDVVMKQRGLQPWSRPLPDYKHLYDQTRFTDAERELYEHFLIPNFQILMCCAEQEKKGLLHVSPTQPLALLSSRLVG